MIRRFLAQRTDRRADFGETRKGLIGLQEQIDSARGEPARGPTGTGRAGWRR